MILYASQRGRSAELAAHLLNGDQNDHVTVHEIRGFVAQDIAGALRESYAMSRGTRCKQFLFSVSLNPPEYADVPIEVFEAAIEDIERKLNLVDQPRIVVFHEKNGRRHCHVVWSRIDTDKLKAVHMSHFKMKLMEVSTALFLKHGWKLPKGMQKGQKRSPMHLTREEYRQAVRLSEDPLALKAMFRAVWEQSDSKASFIRALEEHGFLLAKGDRRGFVAIDVKGGIYSLTRWMDIGTRDLKARLGKPEDLPDIRQAKEFLASRMTENLNRFIGEAKTHAAGKRTPIVQELRTLVLSQRQERQSLLEAQQTRWVQETKARALRLPRGFKGIWHKATGAYKQVRLLNETETKAGLERDRRELHALIRSHLQERQELQQTVLFYREEHRKEVFRLRQEIARYVKTATEPFLPQTAAKAEGVAAKETPPLTAQLEQVETKIALLSGDITMLQASLESNLISDEMRSRIRALIERAMAVMHLKAQEAENKQKETQEKEQEVQKRQAELNEYIRQYALLQTRLEEQNRKIEANRSFYDLITNMSYTLNGVPRWHITIMEPPPQYMLDEKTYLKSVVRQRDDNQLVDRVFRSSENESQVSKRPPINPPKSVPDLRRNVLEVKELLARSGLRPPSGGGISRMAPTAIRLNTSATIRFNSQKR